MCSLVRILCNRFANFPTHYPFQLQVAYQNLNFHHGYKYINHPARAAILVIWPLTDRLFPDKLGFIHLNLFGRRPKACDK